MSGYDIEAEDLTYHFAKLVAVDHINFKVGHGEILGFLGPNGAGKTTTIKMLTGQIRPKSGKALLLGVDVADHAAKIKRHIGICFETTNLYEQMSALENLNLFARLFGIKPFDAYQLLARVGLGGREKDRVETYSKGMKQRLMVARAIVNQPKVLFLDEPTAGLDPTSSKAIHNIILQERDRGATILLTTHDMTEADKLSDRVAFMNQGKIVALDTPLALKQQYGRRAIRAKIRTSGGKIEEKQISLDKTETLAGILQLYSIRVKCDSPFHWG